MTLEEARQLIGEYNALPNIDSRMMWDGYSRLPRLKLTCPDCGHTRFLQIGMDELVRMVERGEVIAELPGVCDRCSLEEEDN